MPELPPEMSVVVDFRQHFSACAVLWSWRWGLWTVDVSSRWRGGGERSQYQTGDQTEPHCTAASSGKTHTDEKCFLFKNVVNIFLLYFLLVYSSYGKHGLKQCISVYLCQGRHGIMRIESTAVVSNPRNDLHTVLIHGQPTCQVKLLDTSHMQEPTTKGLLESQTRTQLKISQKIWHRYWFGSHDLGHNTASSLKEQ